MFARATVLRDCKQQGFARRVSSPPIDAHPWYYIKKTHSCFCNSNPHLPLPAPSLHSLQWHKVHPHVTYLEYSGRNRVLEHVAASGKESILIELKWDKIDDKRMIWWRHFPVVSVFEGRGGERASVHRLLFFDTNFLSLRVMQTYTAILTFKSVDEILWCDYSYETSLSQLSRGNVSFLVFYKLLYFCLMWFVVDFPHLLPGQM